MANLLKSKSTLTDRYQTTIPDTVRKALHLNKRDKILFTVQANGQVSLSKVDETHSDPLIDDFLNFLAKDIKQNPQHLTPVNQTLIDSIAPLIANVEVDLNKPLPDEEETHVKVENKGKLLPR